MADHLSLPAGWLSGLDARLKIGGVAFLGLLVFRASPLGTLVLSAFLAGLARLAGLGMRRLRETLRPLGIFVAFLAAAHGLFTPGKTLVLIPALGLALSEEGLYQACLVTWQFTALVVAAAALTATTSPSDLVAGLERLLRPLKRLGVPVQDLAVMIGLAFRLLPLLREELDRIRQAQAARGLAADRGSLPARLRNGLRPVLPLVTGAFRRAEELAAALEARGYDSQIPRTGLHGQTFSRKDLAAAMILSCLGAAWLLAERMTHVP